MKTIIDRKFGERNGRKGRIKADFSKLCVLP